MSRFSENLRTRIPSFRQFVARAATDRRRIAYDLLPVVSTPRARDRVARVIASFRPHTPGFHPSAEARARDALLRSDGVALNLPPVPAALVAEMRDYFQRTPCHDPYRPQLGRFRWDMPASPESNMGYFTAADTVAAPHVLRLFNDPVILETAELYLGCKPLLDNIACWWSFGDRPAAKGTQRYHRDLDSFRGFKLFVYLTDVDERAGPHVFVKGSHRDARLDTGRAQSDETIRGVFGAAAETVVTGPAGTRFVADTFGFHKGMLPVDGRRLLLTAQYTVNRTPHLPMRPFARAMEPKLDPYVNRLVLQTHR